MSKTGKYLWQETFENLKTYCFVIRTTYVLEHNSFDFEKDKKDNQNWKTITAIQSQCHIGKEGYIILGFLLQ